MEKPQTDTDIPPKPGDQASAEQLEGVDEARRKRWRRRRRTAWMALALFHKGRQP